MQVRRMRGYHQTFRDHYENHINDWNTAVDVSRLRCGQCWLRKYDCRCSYLTERRDFYHKALSAANVRICIYYHFMEIGRSANTAHVFPLICPDYTTTVIHGDKSAEDALIEQIIQETLDGSSRTCLLYPCRDSISLDEWLHQPGESMHLQQTSEKPKLRLIILDGTYRAAAQLLRFIQKNMQTNHSLANSISLVHLNLPENTRSAAAGFMYQPAKDKICSFQAIALAVHEVLKDQGLLNALTEELDNWIMHILNSRVKNGKHKEKASIKDVDNSPAEYVKEIIVSKFPLFGFGKLLI